uniref:Ig-like domain-containing protein n=1 Tax=Stegastes partitus TaxID=144197 RepID=A0A3B5ADE8_9TELE
MMCRLTYKFFLFVFVFFCKGQEEVTQPIGDGTAAEGETVTLECTFKTSSTIPRLFWYKQESCSSPQLLIATYSEKTEMLSVKHDKHSKELHLQISSAAVSDSAVYDCALQPSDKKQQNSV